MTEQSTDTREVARGNVVIAKIVEEQGEGLIISWVGSNLKPTYIDSFGEQLPLYNYVKEQIPDLKKAAGKSLSVFISDDGKLEGLGETGQRESVSITKDK